MDLLDYGGLRIFLRHFLSSSLIHHAQISVIGAGCITVSVNPKFRTPRWRPFRAGMFVAMGLSAAVPVVHGALSFGVGQLQKQMGLSWVISQGVLYIIGAAIYAVGVLSNETIFCIRTD